MNHKGIDLNFETVLKIVSPLLIILGVVNLTSYYSQFRIPILNYLGFTEILTLFLDKVVYFLFLLTPLLIGFIDIEEKDEKISLSLGLSLVIIGSIIIFVNEDGVFDFITFYILLAPLLVYGSFFLLRFIEQKFILNKSDENKGIDKVVVAMILFVEIILLISLQGWANAKRVKMDHPYSGTEMTFDGRMTISNDSCYYVGKSEQYIFMYDEKKMVAVIYPISKLDMLKLKYKNYKRKLDHPEGLPPTP